MISSEVDSNDLYLCKQCFVNVFLKTSLVKIIIIFKIFKRVQISPILVALAAMKKVAFEACAFLCWHCHTTSHSTNPHPMNRARRWYTVVKLFYDLRSGIAMPLT